MSTLLFSIRDWEKNFECAQSRKVTGPLTWFPMPTKHDGKGFRRIMALMDGPAIYGAWVLLLAVAAKSPVRGRLADADGPLSAADLELKTGCAAEVFDRALKVLSSKEIGWLLGEQWDGDGSTVALQDRTRQDRTEQDKDCCAVSAEPARSGQPATATPSEFVFDTAGKGPKTWTLPAAKLAEYVNAYPALDVPSEMRKARQWCRDKVRQRKTAGGMLGFLTSWLNRSQNSGGGRSANPATATESKGRAAYLARKALEHGNNA